MWYVIEPKYRFESKLVVKANQETLDIITHKILAGPFENENDAVKAQCNTQKPGINGWPYPYVEEQYNLGNTEWLETNEQTYWDQLECLPPARISNGAFMVGEPWRHDLYGNAIHAAFMQVGERYFCRMARKNDFNPCAYRVQIKRQFGC
jgi:hypothetical protein